MAASLSVSLPHENQQISSIKTINTIHVSCSVRDVEKLYVNGIPVSIGWGGRVEHSLTISGFGLKEVSFIAITKERDVISRVVPIVIRKGYPDVVGHWAQKEIEYVSTLGYMGGKSGGISFFPDDGVSRAELAKVLTLVNGIDVVSYTKDAAKDVLANNWARLYINAAISNRLLSVDRFQNFYPRGLVTRSDMFSAASKAFDWKIKKTEGRFLTDVPEKFWARDTIYTAMYLGVIPDRWDLSKGLYPGNILTRSELAAIIARIPKVNKEIDSLSGEKVVFKSAFYKIDNDQSSEDIAEKASMISLSSTVVTLNGTETLSVFYNANMTPLAGKIDRVEVDLTPLGKLANTAMLDDGFWGDSYASDGVYSVEVIPLEDISTGDKKLLFQIIDVKGNTYEESVAVRLVDAPLVVEIPTPSIAMEPELVVSSNVDVSVAVTSSVVTSNELPAKKDFYIVQPGDTLLVVAKKMTGNVHNWSKLAEYNSIPVIERRVGDKVQFYINIHVGQKVMIPEELLK